ncbi:unnamed protein product [Spodoptera littoralis]|uniref:Uncharacterized protein n=1 Tax=Spodoptera littoralis TaxID=7109 RepID=A0A9P0N327_SPOLI|nr:unnamed protein product [Spodoptera littoralis]CAH1638091.1 unnamed protein product [Spodoptera littoralis]
MFASFDVVRWLGLVFLKFIQLYLRLLFGVRVSSGPFNSPGDVVGDGDGGGRSGEKISLGLVSELVGNVAQAVYFALRGFVRAGASNLKSGLVLSYSLHCAGSLARDTVVGFVDILEVTVGALSVVATEDLGDRLGGQGACEDADGNDEGFHFDVAYSNYWFNLMLE